MGVGVGWWALWCGHTQLLALFCLCNARRLLAKKKNYRSDRRLKRAMCFNIEYLNIRQNSRPVYRVLLTWQNIDQEG